MIIGYNYYFVNFTIIIIITTLFSIIVIDIATIIDIAIIIITIVIAIITIKLIIIIKMIKNFLICLLIYFDLSSIENLFLKLIYLFDL
jgi:hypothetical protein